MRRRDYFLGTMALGVAVSAAWAILLVLLSLIEANLIQNWGVDLHFFHLPYFSDGSPLRLLLVVLSRYGLRTIDPTYLRGGASLQQFWVYFTLLLFMYLLGFLPGSIYQRFGRIGMYILAGVAFLLLSVFLLVSTYWNWWGSHLRLVCPADRRRAALWMLPLIAICALASYALLRKATV